jgi:serine protease
MSSRTAPAGGAHVVTRVLRLPRRETVAAALARLRRRPGVAYAQPDYIAHEAGDFYPNDPGRAGVAGGWDKTQWNLLAGAGVNAPEAWSNLIADGHPGGRGVTVAVLDTGVAYRNWGKYYRSPDLNTTTFVDPYDFIAGNRYPLDRQGHGTFVASAIAESTNNGIGLTGLAYGASIMPIRVLNADGEGDELTIAKGIRYAVSHHAKIINLSLEFLPSQVSSGHQIPEIVSAINDARRHGVMVVGAAGNDETKQVAYPARVTGVVSVGATTMDRCLASYSNGGSRLDIVAPGGGSDAILADDPDCHPERILPSIYQMTLTAPPHWNVFGYPGFYIGTSMASPEVSAAAALVVASGILGPDPTPQQILTRLEQTATPLPAGGTDPNTTYGYGLLNAGAATAPLTATTPTTPTTPTTSTATTVTTSTTR